jgi:hypothetical protein
MNIEPLHVVWVLAIALVVANTIVSVAVARAEDLARSQVLAQLAVVWLIPVLGAAVIGTFLWSEAHPGKRLEGTISPGEAPGYGDAHGMDGGGHAP